MTWLAFHWTPEWQFFARDEESYVHKGRTNTNPSHDVAHLMLAAGSRLPWRPIGSRDAQVVAEFHALVLERLCFGSLHGKTLDDSLAYAKHLVCEHYSPFPLSFDDALESFKDGLDVESVLRLSPIMFNILEREATAKTYMEATYRGRFFVSFAPVVRPSVAPAVVELARAIACLLEP